MYKIDIPQFAAACWADTLKSDKPIIAIAGATVSGVIYFKISPIIPASSASISILS